MGTRSQNKNGGQAIIMVTLALFAMVGLMGLAVDFGWAFFVKEAAQRAADAAALAAVKASWSTLTGSGPYTCTANPCPNPGPCMVCQPTPQTCGSGGITAGSNLYNGCQYAARNGFTSGGRQTVRLMSDVTSPFNTRTGPVTTHYWVTAIVTESIPQLFSAILGNGTATVAATATAAMVDITVPGSLILLNRRNDPTYMSSVPGGGTQYGLNIFVQANDDNRNAMVALQTRGGIRMSSDCDHRQTALSDSNTCSAGSHSVSAGWNWGGGTVRSPDTKIRGTGWYELANGADWIERPTNGHATGFADPMTGLTQPPPKLPAQSWTPRAVLGGVINAEFCEQLAGTPGGACPPGQYFAIADCQGCSRPRATGDPININGSVQFGTAGAFGNFAFYGGIRKSGNEATVTFSPGIYTFAGVKSSQNAPGVLFDTSTNLNLLDHTTGTGANTDPGALFIMTDGTYGGRLPVPIHESWITGLEDSLDYGTVILKAGNNQNSRVNLHGLNPTHAQIQGSELDPYAPTILWWDRDNSHVQHDATGNVVICGSGPDEPCFNLLNRNGSPELQFGASPQVNLYGVVYQPRGAWTSLGGGGNYAGPVQLITGAIEVKANSTVDLVVPTVTLTITITALIQ